MNNKPGNYDDIKFESSEHSGIFINDVSKLCYKLYNI